MSCSVFGWVGVDALEHVDEVVVGVDLVQAAGYQQALDGGDGLGADLAPAEQPVPAAHGNRAQGALQVIGVDGYVGVVEAKSSSPRVVPERSAALW
jgi:hypothetical protein